MVEYLYSKEQAAQMRSQIMEEYVKPRVKACFDRYPQLQSAMLLVAQYWADEANDAVHDQRIFSVLETPDLEAAFQADKFYKPDPINLPGFQTENEIYDVWWSVDETNIQNEEEICYWYDNGIAIPAFAAFCKEGCHQEMDMEEAYSPYAILRRKGEEIEVEIVGRMYRPWLDGVKPEEWEEE